VTRFTVINVKRSKEHEFVHISIQVLEKERIYRDVAVIIAEAVFNGHRCRNIRECIRTAKLVGGNDVSRTQRVINTFVKYNEI
jgi:hypothetical protein